MSKQEFWTGFWDGLALGAVWRLLNKVFAKDKA